MPQTIGAPVMGTLAYVTVCVASLTLRGTRDPGCGSDASLAPQLTVAADDLAAVRQLLGGWRWTGRAAGDPRQRR